MNYKLALIFCLGIYTINAQKQQLGVIPLEDYHLYPNNENYNIQDGMYFKDINNHLNKFVGTWIGSYDDKILRLEISIIENKNKKARDVSFDELLIKYKIVDDSGNTIINTLTHFDLYRYHIKGKFFGNTPTQYYASYEGLEWECNQKGTAFIDYINNSTITFWILPDSDIIGPECPDGNIHILPTTKATEVTLTKQN